MDCWHFVKAYRNCLLYFFIFYWKMDFSWPFLFIIVSKQFCWQNYVSTVTKCYLGLKVCVTCVWISTFICVLLYTKISCIYCIQIWSVHVNCIGLPSRRKKKWDAENMLKNISEILCFLFISTFICLLFWTEYLIGNGKAFVFIQ